MIYRSKASGHEHGVCPPIPFALKATFEDGTSQEILTGIFSTTDGYDELFYSDYNYGAWLVERLASPGTACSLSDREILEREVKQLDPECREGFDRMVEYIRLQ